MFSTDESSLDKPLLVGLLNHVRRVFRRESFALVRVPLPLDQVPHAHLRQVGHVAEAQVGDFIGAHHNTDVLPRLGHGGRDGLQSDLKHIWQFSIYCFDSGPE